MVEFSNTFKQLNAINLKCTMPKRQAVVIFPEVNYKLSLVMENGKIGILVLIMHTAWSPNTSS
jgi:hypothetical protein